MTTIVVFPHGSLWMTEGYTILVGTEDRLRIDLEQVERRLRRDGVRQDLRLRLVDVNG